MFWRYFFLTLLLMLIVFTGSSVDKDIHERPDSWKEAREFVEKIVNRTNHLDNIVVQSATMD